MPCHQIVSPITLRRREAATAPTRKLFPCKRAWRQLTLDTVQPVRRGNILRWFVCPFSRPALMDSFLACRNRSGQGTARWRWPFPATDAADWRRSPRESSNRPRRPCTAVPRNSSATSDSPWVASSTWPADPSVPAPICPSPKHKSQHSTQMISSPSPPHEKRKWIFFSNYPSVIQNNQTKK